MKILSKERIVFDAPIDGCGSMLGKNNKRDFELFSNDSQIIDSTEQLVSIKYAVRFNFNRLIQFSLSKNREVNVSYLDKDNITRDSTLRLDEPVFERIQLLIQILPLEDYNSEYNYSVDDGVNYTIIIETDKIKKEINVKGWHPRGLDNLVGFLEFQLNGKWH